MRLIVADGGKWGDLRVRFDTKTWNTKKHGLIYSDSSFQKHLKRALVSKMGLSEGAVQRLTYSEQGMQGENEVSFDVGERFVKEWVKKHGEQHAPASWSFGNLTSKLRGQGAKRAASAAPADCYGPDHKMGMVVPKGGSSCARCTFGHSQKDGPHCSNRCWVETPKRKGGGGGKTHLPVMDPSTYCCDMYARVGKAKPPKPALKAGA